MLLLVTGLLCGASMISCITQCSTGTPVAVRASVVEKVLAAEFQFIHTAGHGQLLDELSCANQLRDE